MLNTLRAPVGNMRIFIRIWIRILHVVQSLLAALKFCFKTCVAMKLVDDDDDESADPQVRRSALYRSLSLPPKFMTTLLEFEYSSDRCKCH